MKKNIIIILIALAFSLNSCSDEAPFEYISQKQCETILMVGDPIENVKLLETQPLDEPYYYDNAVIRDADVSIIVEDDTLDLVFDMQSLSYKYPDESVKVLPETVYKLHAKFADGDVITGRTVTPSVFSWDKKPVEYAQFPVDTINLPSVDSLYISWTKPENSTRFLLSIKCLDTLEYGKYLDPPQPENKNRRAYSPFSDDDSNYLEPTFYALLANTKTDFVWLAFKWYGKNSVKIYNPDYNFMRWAVSGMRFSGSTEYDANLSSVEGGIGVFGSASYISGETFILKNQP